MLRVLTTYANRTAIGFAAIGREHEDPLAACGLEECAARDDDGLLRLTQFEVDAGMLRQVLMNLVKNAI